MKELTADHFSQLAGGGKAVLGRLYREIRELGQSFEEESDDKHKKLWASQMRGVIDFCGALHQGSRTARALALYYFRLFWDELPLDFRSAWGYNFYNFATKASGDEPVTIDHQLRAIETFFVRPDVLPSMPVEVPKRDESGNPVMVEGRPVLEPREWDPESVPLSKLVALVRRAREGTMTPRLWALAADPACTLEMLREELIEAPSASCPSPGIQFQLVGSLLVAAENGTVVELGELTVWEDYYHAPDSLEHRALSRLCLILGLRPDVDEKTSSQLLSAEEVRHAYYNHQQNTAS